MAMNAWVGNLSQKLSIRNQIVFLILVILILPLFVTFYYLDKSLEKAIQSKIGHSAQEALALAGRNIEFETEEMFSDANDIAQSARVIQLLQDPKAFTPYEKYELQLSELNKVSRSNHPSFVTIADNYGNLTASPYTEPEVYGEIMRSDWQARLRASPNQLLWLFRKSNYAFADKRPTVSLAQIIRDPQTHRGIGVLLYSKAEEDIYSGLAGLEGEVYLVDASGTIISSGDKDKLGAALPKPYEVMDLRETSSGQATVGDGAARKIVNYYGIGQTGWCIVQVIPYDTVFKEIFDIRKENFLISAIIVALFVLLTVVIASSISRPLILLVKKMTGMENNQFSSPITVNGPKEISALQMTYNQMLGQLKDLLQRVKDEYKQKEEMRFRALQAQINPHFLLNTLNNIKWMAFLRGEREVGTMLSNLAGLMEGSIGRGSDLNTLRDEVEYIRNYVALVKLKFNEKLDVAFDIPDDLLPAETIQFMLQPIVENCVEHGLTGIPGKGLVEVKATRSQGMLLLTVRDNGAGMSEARLQEVRSWLDADHPGNGAATKRIGVRNVHERLKLHYGDNYGLSIDSRPGEGATVTYRLPILLRKEEDASAD